MEAEEQCVLNRFIHTFPDMKQTTERFGLVLYSMFYTDVTVNQVPQRFWLTLLTTSRFSV